MSSVASLFAKPYEALVLFISGYRGTSIIRNSAPLGPYRRLMPRVLGGSIDGENVQDFLQVFQLRISEVHLSRTGVPRS